MSSKPYGSWPSPITLDTLLGSTVPLSEVLVARPSRTGQATGLVWSESRAAEAGRNAIVYRSLSGHDEQVIPDAKFNARTRVHEYGGGAVGVLNDEEIIFSSFQGPVYSTKRSDDGTWSEPKQVSPPSDVHRFADFDAHPSQPSLVLAVLEDHTHDTPAEVVNKIVVFDVSADKPELIEIASGADFYSNPRWSPQGTHVSWIQWMHPDMPWEGSELYVARVAVEGDRTVQVEPAQKIAGEGKGKESVSQARWALEEDKLVFLDDRTGFHELYSWTESEGVESVLQEPTGADIGPPEWVFGLSTHAPLSKDKWICQAKGGNLRVIDLGARTSKVLETPYATITSFRVVSETQIAAMASPDATPDLLALLDIQDSAVSTTTVKLSSSTAIDEGYISVGQQVSYPSKDGATAYARYYAPTSKDYKGEDGELPPLVVKCHGGPTSSAGKGLYWDIQLFTSRGFAVVDVDYGGSTGYGKKYRQRLDGNWGIVDVEDTIACVEHLVKERKADKKRVAIKGGSAGGFTVLAALCAGDVFGAGCSHYGVADLKMLADDTHKFESQYLFGLLGGTPAEVPDHYKDRSPITNAANIKAPLLLLQGSEDRVVPQEQATMMLDKIKEAGGQCDIMIFEGEGHGFRMRENKKTAMESELEFFRKTFGIEGGKA